MKLMQLDLPGLDRPHPALQHQTPAVTLQQFLRHVGSPGVWHLFGGNRVLRWPSEVGDRATSRAYTADHPAGHRLVTRYPDSLDEDERMQLKQILVRSPELAATHRHVHDFAEIMTNRESHRLPAWMGEFDQHGESYRGFAPTRGSVPAVGLGELGAPAGT